MTTRFLMIMLLIATFSTGCNLIYKQNIQQGNAIEQDDLDELYIGMNQRQVLFVLGTPSVKDPFNPDRWDYVQTFSRRGSDPVMRTVTLRFDKGLLSQIDGQQDPFAATSGGDDTVASFVKPKTDQAESPQDAAVGSVEEEVLQGADPDIEAVNERNAEDREYQRDMEILDQKQGNMPDIDG